MLGRAASREGSTSCTVPRAFTYSITWRGQVRWWWVIRWPGEEGCFLLDFSYLRGHTQPWRRHVLQLHTGDERETQGRWRGEYHWQR